LIAISENKERSEKYAHCFALRSLQESNKTLVRW